MAREFQQAPGGGELWKVGSTHYLVYTVPTAKPPVYMSWKIDDATKLRAVVGADGSTKPDRTMTREQWRRAGVLDFGMSTELVNYSSAPFEQLIRDFETESFTQPWLKDPEVMAYVAQAMLEGRQVSPAELAKTDYFQNHSSAELEWAVLKATDPSTARKQRGDARLNVQAQLRERGIDAPSELVDLLADNWSSGKWTETMVSSQIAGLNDPYLGIDLDQSVIDTARGFRPDKGDAKAVEGGRDAVRKRITDIFKNRGVDAGVHLDGSTEDRNARLDRLADEVMAGDTSIGNIRSAVNRQAGLNPTSEIDLTREGEAEVKQLVIDWLGPQLAKQYEGRWLRGWAGQLRSDPNAQDKLVDELKRLRKAAFSEWEDDNLRYADIAPTTKALFDQVWQESVDETDPLFMEVLRMTGPGGGGMNAAASKLRREGLQRGVRGVTQEASAGILAAGGGDVRQSLV